MCGPSSAMKNLNNMVQGFTSQVTSEAGTVFGNSNSVFNNIMNAVQGIVNGGPTQSGFSGEALANMNATAEDAGAAMTRNLKGAATATMGTGAVDPGANLSTTLNAEQQGAADVAQTKNNIQIENSELGQQNYEAAVQQEMNAPGVFQTANSFNATAGKQQASAQQSQNQIDQQENWWKDPVMKVAATAAQFIPYVGPYVSTAIKDVGTNYNQINAQENQDFNTLGGWNEQPSGGGGGGSPYGMPGMQPTPGQGS